MPSQNSTRHPSSRGDVRSLVMISAVVVSLMSAACGGGAPAQSAAAPPPTAVTTTTLAPTAIDDTSDFIATLRSLRSTTIQPEVEGLVTRIFVKAGQRVNVGTPLVQINPAKQQAAVSSSEANRAGTEADVQVLAPADQAHGVVGRGRCGQPG